MSGDELIAKVTEALDDALHRRGYFRSQLGASMGPAEAPISLISVSGPNKRGAYMVLFRLGPGLNPDAPTDEVKALAKGCLDEALAAVKNAGKLTWRVAFGSVGAPPQDLWPVTPETRYGEGQIEPVLSAAWSCSDDYIKRHLAELHTSLAKFADVEDPDDETDLILVATQVAEHDGRGGVRVVIGVDERVDLRAARKPLEAFGRRLVEVAKRRHPVLHDREVTCVFESL